MATNSCAQCGTTIIEVEGDEGYFTLTQVTSESENDWDFCGSACLMAFIEEATAG